MDNSIRNWLDLRGLAVTIPGEGRSVGKVDDFYYKEDTNAVYALRVKQRIYGFKALATSAISTIGPDAVTVANEQMLIDESNDGELSQLPLGNNLLSYKVLSESGTLLGTVGNILHRSACSLAHSGISVGRWSNLFCERGDRLREG